MGHIQISNIEYLDRFLENPNEQGFNVLLPHEGAYVDAAVDQQRRIFDKIIEAKIEVTGGDDWHDGAFRATDNEAKIVSQQMSAISPYIGAPIVGYPNESEKRATLGSRLVVSQNGFVYPVDIIGFRAGYPEGVTEPGYDDEVVGMSPESPLAKTLLGQCVGFEAQIEMAGRPMKVTIEHINQIAVKGFFMQEAHTDNQREQ